MNVIRKFVLARHFATICDFVMRINRDSCSVRCDQSERVRSTSMVAHLQGEGQDTGIIRRETTQRYIMFRGPLKERVLQGSHFRAKEN